MIALAIGREQSFQSCCSASISVYATAGYLFNLGGAHQRTFGGGAGVRPSS
jgi:hypothetical protein